MAYIDDYKARLQAYGNTHSEVKDNTTADLINKTFVNSHEYKVVSIGGANVDTRVKPGKDYKNKSLLFRPNAVAHIGELITFDSESWLVFDFTFNEKVFPKADIQLCNEIIRWKDRDGSLVEYDCVAAASRYIKYDIRANRYDVELLQGGMFVYVSLNEDTRNIKPSQRFIIGGSVYEISGIDDLTFVNRGKGLIQFTTKLSTIQTNDDFVNKIADNSTLYLSETGNTTPSGGSDTGGGGDLW